MTLLPSSTVLQWVWGQRKSVRNDASRRIITTTSFQWR